MDSGRSQRYLSQITMPIRPINGLPFLANIIPIKQVHHSSALVPRTSANNSHIEEII